MQSINKSSTPIRVVGMRPYFNSSEDSNQSSTEEEVCVEVERRLLPVTTRSFAATDYRDYVPYKLTLANASLFPEFYFYFERSFNLTATEKINLKSLSSLVRSFVSPIVGHMSVADKNESQLEDVFDQTFRQCLGPELLEEFRSWKFTKQNVATAFSSELSRTADYVSKPQRVNVLVAKALKGDVLPYLNFMTAFKYSTEEIWREFLIIFCREQSETKVQEINNRAIYWSQAYGDIEDQICGFVSHLKNTGILVFIEEEVEKRLEDTCLSKVAVTMKYGQNWMSQAILREHANMRYRLAHPKKRAFTIKRVLVVLMTIFLLSSVSVVLDTIRSPRI